nr:MAG TPA: hypothetical protein [Caudoviricetes sp.]
MQYRHTIPLGDIVFQCLIQLFPMHLRYIKILDLSDFHQVLIKHSLSMF